MDSITFSDNLKLFAGDIFDEYFITDDAVRTRVVEMMIESGDVFSTTDMKYNLSTLLRDNNGTECIEESKVEMTVGVGLSYAQRDILTLSQPEYNLKWSDAPTMPHGLGFAQRICDTLTLFRGVPAKTPCVLDIGGNWTYYPADKGFTFVTHACNLVDGWRELHRQTQRVVLLESGKPCIDYCTAGVENCDYHAPWFVSVHTLPCIDPVKWPDIFRRHGLEGGEAIFHYEPRMDTSDTSGVIPEVCMNWEDVDGVVHFNFQEDSSLPYEHSRAWLKRYARPGIFTDDSWDKLINYRIISHAGGSITSRMDVLDKATVGVVPPRKWLRWVGGDGDVIVPVPKFDPGLGRPASDPAAYRCDMMSVPGSLYEFVFGRGYTNDTMRPDKPLSRADVLGAVRSYNFSKMWNGVAINHESRLTASTVDDVTTGIYLAIVFRSARTKVVLGAMTEQMLRLQRKWGNTSIIKLIMDCVSYTALSPFLLLTNTVQEAIDVVTLYLRTVGEAGLFASMPSFAEPYVELDESEGITGLAMAPGIPHKEPVEIDDTDRKKAFYMSYRNELPLDIRVKLEHQLYGGVPPEDVTVDKLDNKDIKEEVLGETVQSGNETRKLYKPALVNVEELVLGNRAEWRRWYEEFRPSIPDWARNDDVEPIVGSDVEVTQYANEMVMEYALYQLDLTLNVENRTIDYMDVHWRAGVIDDSALSADNITKGIGARFWVVSENNILGMDNDNCVKRVVDPVTRKFLDVREVNGEYKVGNTAQDLVYSTSDLRIANGRKLARTALKAIRDGIDMKDVKFELIDGIAGSGKTRTMTEVMTPADVFTTGPRAPKDKILEWARNQDKFSKHLRVLDKKFRTTDSSICWGLPDAEILYSDEGLMEHHGAHILKAHLSKTKSVIVSGDTAQIRFIDRGSGFGRLGFIVNKFWHKITYLNVSERMPADATLLCRQFYPEWRRPLIKTRSPIRRSMRLEVIPDTNSIRYTEGKDYEYWVCILQGCKAQQVSKPSFVDIKVAVTENHGDLTKVRPVGTAHEVQGSTYPVVVAFRLNRFSAMPLESKPHLYVVSSRHTHRFVYRTVANEVNDMLARLVRQSEMFTEEELDEVCMETPEPLKSERLEMLEKIVKVHGP